MDKFKELIEIELVEITGGDLGPIDKLFDHWTFDALAVVGDTADFISGLGDGFRNGFNNNNKYW